MSKSTFKHKLIPGRPAGFTGINITALGIGMVIVFSCGGLKQKDQGQPGQERRPMQFFATDTVTAEPPAIYLSVFDTSQRYPKAFQTIFFSPAQPINAWGEPSVNWHNGQYFLWWLNWSRPASHSLATSRDGVYWREEGLTFLPDSDDNFVTGEAEIYRFGHHGPYYKFYHGPKDVSIATSCDLVNWQRLGGQFDLEQDPRWYDGRWDSYFILPDEENDGWMTVINAVPREGGRGFGFATSKDGLLWETQPPARAEIPWLEDQGYIGEISGWVKLGGRYFLTCDSWVGRPWGKTTGAGLQRVFVSEHPKGPYRPTERNYIIGVSPSVYEKFHWSADGELITESMVWTFPENSSRCYHVPPFKLVESDGESLWYRWWKGNEKLKVHPVDPGSFEPMEGSGGSILIPEEPLPVEKGILVEGIIDYNGIDIPAKEADWAEGAITSSSSGRNWKDGPIDGFPEAAIDGNPETSWRINADNAGDEVWYELDFGTSRPIGRLRILWWQRDYLSYKIELSEDRINWETVCSEEVTDEVVLYSGQEHMFSEITFVNGLSKKARYMKILAKTPEVIKRINPRGNYEIGFLAGKCGLVEINVYERPDVTVGKESGSLPGLYFECEGGGGEAVLFSPNGLAHFGWINENGTGFEKYLEREIGTSPGKQSSFRIVQRDDLAELYLDDYHLYIMHIRKTPTGRLGLITSGGENHIKDLKVWHADPDYYK
jgi:hypothetical protein